MRALRDHRYGVTSRGPFTRPRRGMGIGVIALVFVSLALLLLSRLDHPYVRQLRWHIMELVTPVLNAAMVPLEPIRWAGGHVTRHFDLVKEVEALRDENQRLRSWEWRALELERMLADLSALSRVVRDPEVAFVTSRVIANSSGPFVRTAMIGAGREQNLRAGHPVINADGLVGRVVETGRSGAQVLLLTDLNSRIPVVIGAKGARALLIGNNGSMPGLGYVPAGSDIRVGDEVSTSGIGGLFPRGLRIGTVVDEGGVLKVRPYARLDDLEYVSVLLFETPALDLASEGVQNPMNGAHRAIAGAPAANGPAP